MLARRCGRRLVAIACRKARALPSPTDPSPTDALPVHPGRIFDRSLLASRRQRVAGTAEAHDFLLDRVADELAERLSIVKRRFPLAANIGAHHGLVSERIRGIAGTRRIIDVDGTASLLGHAADLRVVADEEALPFADASLDLIVSGLALQMVNDLPGTLVQMRRALKPDGLLLASLLGGATLTELREAWIAAETEISGGVSPRVAPFADVRDMGALLQRAGFALPVVDSETLTVTYADPIALMREIKNMGASNMLLARRRTPVLAPPAAASGRYLRRALRRCRQSRAGNIRNPDPHRLGAGPEPAQAAAAGLGDDAARRRARRQGGEAEGVAASRAGRAAGRSAARRPAASDSPSGGWPAPTQAPAPRER